MDVARGMVFQSLGICKDTFDARLISQKKIYLLQALGTDLGYSYNWYVRGPYSPDLTTYMYEKLDVLTSEDYSMYEMAEDVIDKIESVNSLDDSRPSGLTESSWYELLASLLYINNNKESWKVTNSEELFSKLIQHKPKYDKAQCEKAHSALSTIGAL